VRQCRQMGAAGPHALSLRCHRCRTGAGNSRSPGWTTTRGAIV
jgi:hypothetical protein